LPTCGSRISKRRKKNSKKTQKYIRTHNCHPTTNKREIRLAVAASRTFRKKTVGKMCHQAGLQNAHTGARSGQKCHMCCRISGEFNDRSTY
jgi:hypothetical protein